MAVTNYKILINTNGKNDVIDLTYKVKGALEECNVKTASVLVHCPFSSASIGVMEYDPDIVKDFSKLINSIVPVSFDYKHDVKWDDCCAQYYIKTLFIGNSVTVPFVNGEFELDRFQRILLFEFNDRPIVRSVIIQMIY